MPAKYRKLAPRTTTLPDGSDAIVMEGASPFKKVSKKGGVGGPVALTSGYENTYPLPNRPE